MAVGVEAYGLEAQAGLAGAALVVPERIESDAEVRSLNDPGYGQLGQHPHPRTRPGQVLRDLKSGRLDGAASMHGEVAVFGSANLIRSLIPLGLIDRYQLLIFPPVLGSGKRMFEEGAMPTDVTLRACRTTSSGVVISTYLPTPRTDRPLETAVSQGASVRGTRRPMLSGPVSRSSGGPASISRCRASSGCLCRCAETLSSSALCGLGDQTGPAAARYVASESVMFSTRSARSPTRTGLVRACRNA